MRCEEAVGFPRVVMDRRSRPGPESTTLEAVGNQWRYAIVVVQAGEEEEDFYAYYRKFVCKFTGASRNSSSVSCCYDAG